MWGCCGEVEGPVRKVWGMGPMKWRDKGRCKGVDPEVFYPEDDEDPGFEAKEICATCPVRETCLEHAITAREKAGVWGGYTARERRRLVRQRRRAS
jgi:WhiB family transcriptional regulator, redox-sensing transcriptional regulator